MTKLGLMYSFGKILVLSVLFSVGFAWADDYMDSLEMEAQKVGETEPASTEISMPAADAAVVAEQRKAFTAYLRERHKGSYALYRGLSIKNKNEIFEKYASGADMKDVSKMIVNKRLKR